MVLNSRDRIAIAITVIVFLLLGGMLAHSRLPHGDEGHFASAGYEVAYNGRLAMPMWTPWVASLDRVMFVTMPMYFLQLGPWVRLFGSELSAVRMNAVAWGAISIVCWYLTVFAITNSRFSAFLSLLLIGLNYDFVNQSVGRYDPMAAAMNSAALAAFLCLRKRNFNLAVLAGCACSTVACLTHPYGIFSVAGLGIFILFLDWRRVRPVTVAAAALPFIVGFGLYGWYAMEHKAEFVKQLSTNAGDRLKYLKKPAEALSTEIQVRYLWAYAGFREHVPIYMRLKALYLIAYLVGFIGLLVSARRRRDPARLALCAYGVTAFLLLTFCEGYRWYIYLTHALPIYGAILTVAVGDLVEWRPRLRTLAVAGGVASALFAIASIGYRARIDDYHALYETTGKYLQTHVSNGDLVYSPAEFGPMLGFASHVLDDPHYGVRTGKMAKVLVFDRAAEERVAETAKGNKVYDESWKRLIAQYHLVYERNAQFNFYKVYSRNGAADAPQASLQGN